MNPFRRTPPPVLGAYRRTPPVTIRWSTPADAAQLELLAELDEAAIPPGPVMLGFVGDELWAAAAPSTGATLADPFRPSADMVVLVAERGRQLTVPEQRPRSWRALASPPPGARPAEARFGATT